MKIPKAVRKGPVAQFLASPGGQVAMAEALIIAAGVFASTRPDSATGHAMRHPGESLKAVGRSTVNAKDSVARGSRKLSHAFAEAMKSFRAALQDQDVEAALAHDAEVLQEDAAKKEAACLPAIQPGPALPEFGQRQPVSLTLRQRARHHLRERVRQWLTRFVQQRVAHELQRYREPEVTTGGWLRRSNSQQVFRSLVQINFYPRKD